MLNLVDHHGASFVIYFLGISEMITIVWIYGDIFFSSACCNFKLMSFVKWLCFFVSEGIRNICDDFEFMLRKKVGIYWRVCWKLITPGMLIAILIYSLIEMKQLTYKGVKYPTIALGERLKVMFIIMICL